MREVEEKELTNTGGNVTYYTWELWDRKETGTRKKDKSDEPYLLSSEKTATELCCSEKKEEEEERRKFPLSRISRKSFFVAFGKR